MCTFEELQPHLRKFVNWYGTNYFPKPDCIISHKNSLVELIHVPNDGHMIGITVEVYGIVLCEKDDDGFEVSPKV